MRANIVARNETEVGTEGGRERVGEEIIFILFGAHGRTTKKLSATVEPTTNDDGKEGPVAVWRAYKCNHTCFSPPLLRRRSIRSACGGGKVCGPRGVFSHGGLTHLRTALCYISPTTPDVAGPATGWSFRRPYPPPSCRDGGAR